MRFSFFLCLALLAGPGFSQECTLTLRGYVNDHHEESALAFTTITMEETGRTVVADSAGFFLMDKVCPGSYHFVFSHIGCEPAQIFMRLYRDTVIKVEMEHHTNYLGPFTVERSANASSAQTRQTISRKELNRSSGKDLSTIVENIAGVSTIKNGSGISKPVIHGLSGNRVTIINNGLTQAGQQWGNDHAPEVDPFTAKNITVVKGVDALEYGGNGLGGMVIIDAGNISSDPHLHGDLHYLYQTNGRGHGGAIQIEQGSKILKWRLTASGKKIGDRQSPDYYLRNTGSDETNLSVQLEKAIGKKWFNKLYYSYFDAQIGILRGSHIGNLTDLEQAIERSEPFFTNDDYSTEIASPRQEVVHQLVKFSSKYYFTDTKSVEWIGGFQQNDRKEFDVRRGGRSNIPALDLYLASSFSELNYSSHTPKKWQFKGGIQVKYNDNENDPATGILPLIPDYELLNGAIYGRLKRSAGDFQYEVGGRFDWLEYDVLNITRTLPRVFERNRHEFSNFNVAVGMSYDNRKRWITRVNSGWMQRAPEVNELYSFGLHQGVSGIEEGNVDLNPENGWKTVWSNTYSLIERLTLTTTTYFQYIDDYIFLQPQEKFRLTIRGAFPVFAYQQTDANIYGWDIGGEYEWSERLQQSLKYAAVRGRDRTQNIPLVFMPADNFSSTIRYHLGGKHAMSIESVAINGRYVLEQSRLEDNQDFLAPPPEYFLLGVQTELKWKLGGSVLHANVRADNLLNERYRDYLNRLRYYSDAEGRNVTLALRYEF